MTICSGSRTGRGCKMSWWMSVKIAVFAPMPRASESTATARKTGDLRRVRREYRKSRRIAAIDGYTAQQGKGYESQKTGGQDRGVRPIDNRPQVNNLPHSELDPATQLHVYCVRE